MTRRLSRAGQLKIACIQMAAQIGDIESNRASSLALIEAAADAGTELMVLPELCNSGYLFDVADTAERDGACL